MEDRKLKVLHICTTDRGGAGLCCLRIHQALLGQGIDSKVLTLNKYSTNIPQVYQYGYFKKYGTWKALFIKAIAKVLWPLGIKIGDALEAYHLSLKIGLPTSLPVSLYDVSCHPLVQEADVIHLHWVSNFIDYPSFFQKVKKTIVWTQHDQNLFHGIFHYDTKRYNDLALERKYYEIKRNALAKADHLGIVFLSNMMRDIYSENPMICSRPSTVINNPVDCSLYHHVDRQRARKHFGISKDSIVFVFVAASISEERKGLKMLSSTLQRMNLSNAYILAIGDTSNYTPLPFVHAVGIIRDAELLSVAYSTGDYFVMPSTMEAFAQTPIEAMACGVPAIVFPVSGTEELIRPQNGVRAAGFTSEDLEVAINQAMRTKYDANLIRQDMIDRFSPEIIARQYIDFYERMCGYN